VKLGELQISSKTDADDFKIDSNDPSFLLAMCDAVVANSEVVGMGQILQI
jgi:hypothetical protein